MDITDFLACIVDPHIADSLHEENRVMMTTVAEMLISGNINKIVSQLANIELDELAAPPPKPSILELMEPVVAFLIVLNGVLLGLQSDSLWETWHGWLYIEVFFVTCFVSELLLRFGTLGVAKFFYGHDVAWNMLDLSVVIVALIECSLQETWNGPVLRLLRLTRLSRLLRVLRFRCFLDLTLMLKGLLGGFRTLGWAMVLLLSAIYIISLFVSSTFGKSEVIAELFPADAEFFFGSVPRCMFTAFRCFTGDCSDTAGISMVPVLSETFGYRFTLPYTMCSMLITFGIFNLIIAIYIEATLTAAKQHEATDRSTKKKESLQVAHTTKRLMKRFCTLQRAFSSPDYCLNPDKFDEGWCVDFVDEFDDIDDLTISMNKQMFLTVMEDRHVQTILDDLDVPSGRAHFFDVLDADGNGTLQIVEIVQGILSLRGEPKKSDSVACLLSVRSLQSTLQSTRQEVAEGFGGLLERLPFHLRHTEVGDTGSTRCPRSPSPETLYEPRDQHDGIISSPEKVLPPQDSSSGEAAQLVTKGPPACRLPDASARTWKLSL